MGSLLTGLGGVGSVLSTFVTSIFMIYSAFFFGDSPDGFLNVIITLAGLLFFTWIVYTIPFISLASPILFEWWWHDIPFWEFTDYAMYATYISIGSVLLVLVGSILSSKEYN
jgi:uncharacterized membrane protein YbaN (DUF454 family)